jgi:UDP-N-acetyl-2-amino-2-deoxyglucuronate dehydrogenase
MSKTYTAAIVGCGDIAHYHLRGYQLAGVDVVAVADPLEVARAQFQKEYNIAQGFASVEELLAETVPDIVSVCTWHLLHPAPTIAAAKAGVKAVICEKPMAVGLGPADEMIAACEESGTKLVISHQRRFTPGWEKARELVQGGAIGEVVRVDSKVMAGLLNCGTHAIDGVRFVLDDPEVEWVMGAVERQSERFERDTPIEDGAMALVQMAGGIQLSFQSDLDSKDATPGHFAFRGTEGMVETTESWTRLFNAETGGWQEQDVGVERDKVDVIGGMANARQTKELIAWLEGGPEHRGSGRRARATVEIMMALLESARKNKVVRMPLQEKGYPLELMMAEGLLEATQKGPYDIRGYLQREGVDEGRYAELRAQGMSHHPIMRKLHEEAKD